MEVYSEGIINGKILDKYGKRGSKKRFGMPTLSLPFEIKNSPKGTKSFAVVFDDPDSVPVCNKVWIHWLIANLHKTRVEEGESESSYDFVQGMNTWNDNCYGGPCPPDKAHKYRLTVYALNADLNLTGNFTLEALKREMEGKILTTSQLFGVYDK